MALGEPLPKQVFGHPWLLMGDGKMSKSKGNVLYADEMSEIFGVDAVRYFVLHEMPFENDGVLTWDLCVERFNSDLANTLGNLVNRTISMTNKYFGGEVRVTGVTDLEVAPSGVVSEGQEGSIDEDLKKVVLETPAKVTEKMDRLRVADAISEVFALFKRCNKYIDETAPWILAKGEDQLTKDRLSQVLYNLVEAITVGAELLESFMPDTAGKILQQLNAEKRGLDNMDTFGQYPSGGKVTDQPQILFQRLKAEDVEAAIAKLHEAKAADAAAPESAEAEEAPADSMDVEAMPEISIEDFAKLQIQVGEIVSCEAVKKSKKLLCSQVKIGSKTRQILSGIKQWYSPEEMPGKKVLVITNLKPAKLAGLVSEGMILCAEDDQGRLSLVSPEGEVSCGAQVR